jgi:hypothetical protein
MDQNKAISEFNAGWKEFFSDKTQPENSNERQKQLEEFRLWYNTVRKQSDTQKTPQHMWDDQHGEERRFTADFEDDADLEETEFQVAESMFNILWKEDKHNLKELSKHELAKAMFIEGFLYYSNMIREMENIETDDASSQPKKN